MNSRFIDWIWHVRGSLALAPGQSRDAAFERLDPLFHEAGTTHERTDQTLVFRKKDQAAQDKMSVFDGGKLRIEEGVGGAVLRYDMTSRILLFCFLVPFLFLGVAQITIALANHQKAEAAVAEKSGKAAEAKKKAELEKERKAALPQNPIDQALGAPAMEKPKKKKDKSEEEDKGPRPTAAYVFAAMFALLYVVGRILEDRLVKRLFRKKLLGS